MYKQKPQFGKKKPRYLFAINQYDNYRCSKCPRCKKNMAIRKFALLIHIDEFGILNLGKSCRYCSKCEFIIVHKNDLESILAYTMEQRDPSVIGNEYFVFGTVDLEKWKESCYEKPATMDDLLKSSSDFKEYVDLKLQGGWMPPPTI